MFRRTVRHDLATSAGEHIDGDEPSSQRPGGQFANVQGRGSAGESDAETDHDTAGDHEPYSARNSLHQCTSDEENIRDSERLLPSPVRDWCAQGADEGAQRRRGRDGRLLGDGQRVPQVGADCDERTADDTCVIAEQETRQGRR